MIDRYPITTAAIITVIVILMTTVALVVHGPEKPSSSLSERINAACPRDFEVFDFEVDGEFTSIPPDVIKVTCTAINPSHRPSVVYRSVAR